MRIDGGGGSGAVAHDVAARRIDAEATVSAAAPNPAAHEPPAEPPAPALPPGETLAEMARHGPTLSEVVARQSPLPVPVGEPSFGDQVRGTTQRPIDLAMAQMANDVYSTPEGGRTGTQSEAELAPAGWHRVQPGEVLRTPEGRSITLDPAQLVDPASGFQAAVYQHQNGQVVVAFAGTDPKSVPDLVTDAGQGLGLPTRQYELAARLGVKMAGVFGTENVAFTGHSLGGGLAATATLASGAQGVTFNAAGPSNETLREFGSPNELRADYATNGLLRSYSVKGDPLTVVGHNGTPHPLGTELQTPNLTGTRNPITLHGGGGDHQLYVDGLRSSQAVPTPGASLPDRLTEQSRQAALNTLGTAADVVIGFGRDARQIGRETARDLADVWRNPTVLAPARTAAELADGGLQALGALGDRALDGVGRQTTVVTEALGQGTRELLRGTPWEGRLDGLATRIESSGEVLRGALDNAGNGVRHVAGRTGDLVATLPDRARDVATTALAGGVDVASAAVGGARDVAQTVAGQGLAVARTVRNEAQDVGRSLLGGGREVVASGADAFVDTARSAATGLSNVASTASAGARDAARALREGDVRGAARSGLETGGKVLATAGRETLRHLGVVASETRGVVSTMAARTVDLAREVAGGAAAVASTVVNGVAQVTRSAVDSGRAVVTTALDKAGEVASKLNPFNWSF